MDIQRLLRDIEMKNFSPVYVLTGDEPYFIDQLENAFNEKVLDEAEEAFNKTVVYGQDSKLEDIISLAKGYPMIGNRQLILVKEAQDLKEFRSADALEPLSQYLDQPQPATVLVFSYRQKKLDGRLAVTKKIGKVGVIFKGEKIKDYKLADWIMNFIRERGKKISSRAANILAEYLGADLGKVVSELEKLDLVVKDDEITAVHIEQNIGISKDYNVFELQKAIGIKDHFKANQIIKHFAANPKSHPIQMNIPALYSYFSKMMVFLTLPDKREAAKVMKISPYAVRDYETAARNYTPAKVSRIFTYLRECDIKSKGVDNYSVDDAFLMKELVYKIMH